MITGKVKKYRRKIHKCPRDSAHREKSGGGIRGPHLMRIGETWTAYGNEAFFWPLDYGEGYKVYCSLKGFHHYGIDKVHQIFDEMTRFYTLGIGVKPLKVEYVYVDVVVDGKEIQKSYPAIRVKQVEYPKKAWHRFLSGAPYDWDACIDKSHSAKGFIEFQKKGEFFLKDDYQKHKKSFSLGNSAYCTKEHKWLVMDIDGHHI